MADISIGAAMVRSLINRQFPILAPSRVELLGTGIDNSAFCVNADYIFRFPRGRDAAGRLEREEMVLPLLASRLQVGVPAPQYVGTGDGEFPWIFIGYRKLGGNTAADARPDSDALARLARPLGQFLRDLHDVPISMLNGYIAIRAENDTWKATARVQRAGEAIERLATWGWVADQGLLRKIIDAVPELYVPRADTLVHGNLNPRHLLIDRSGNLTGVIDWGEMHAGDPAEDLAIAFTFIPPECRSEFRRGYGYITPGVWPVARFRALYHALALCQYAFETADPILAGEARVVLHNVSADE